MPGYLCAGIEVKTERLANELCPVNVVYGPGGISQSIVIDYLNFSLELVNTSKYYSS